MTDGDAAAMVAWCIAITAQVAHDLEAEGFVDPQLYTSLKSMQMLFDRQVRKLAKTGQGPGEIFGNLPSPDW